SYTLMVVLNWIRTDKHKQYQDGSLALGYHRLYFNYFDVFLLKRPGAEKQYSPQEVLQAKKLGASLSEQERKQVLDNVLLGLPGSSENFTAENLLALLHGFKDITAEDLKSNLIEYLNQVVP